MSAIELKNVNLDYIIKSGSESLKKTLIKLLNRLSLRKNTSNGNTHYQSYRALKDISLKIAVGDRVGLVGRNGAGKSTLLRTIGQIYKPVSGHIHVNGKIASLFDINLGMNPDATGVENIINLGVMRGFTKKQAEGIIGDVQEFTELGDFLYRPVYSYSSGMSMKLAFAVATAFVPDILLIDEVIGVGDAKFMKKAQQRISNIIDSCQAMVLTSHSNEIIKDFCNKVVVLEKGEIQFIGDTNEGIEFYEQEILGIKPQKTSTQHSPEITATV